MALVDELWSGVAVAGAPAVEHDLVLSHESYALVAFAGPLFLAAVLEAGVAAVSDRLDRARLLAWSQIALAFSLACVAVTTTPWTLLAALAAAGTTSGIACGAAQARMVANGLRGPDHAMLRWSFFSTVGDIATPFATAASIALGFSYRGAMAAIAFAVFAQGIAAMRGSSPSGGLDRAPELGTTSGDDAPALPLRSAFRATLRAPRLWAWLFASASCTLLDELVLALVALRLVHDGRASEPGAAIAVVLFSVGGLAGTALTERELDRSSSRAVLGWSAAASLGALVVLLVASSLLATSVTLFVLGVAVAPHHPLALARAYDELPENPGVVQACLQIFVAIEIGAPLAVGLVADRHGLGAAVALLGIQPLVVLACTLTLSRSSARPR